jgi:hypothetical protein
VEADRLDDRLCIGSALGCPSMLPVCFRCSRTKSGALATRRGSEAAGKSDLPSCLILSVMAAIVSAETCSELSESIEVVLIFCGRFCFKGDVRGRSPPRRGLLSRESDE